MSPRIMPCAAPSGKSLHATSACGSAPLFSSAVFPSPSLVSSAYSRVFPRPCVPPHVACAGPEPAPMPPAPPAPPMR